MPSRARPDEMTSSGGHGLGQVRRVAVRHAGDERAEAQPLGARRQRAEQRVGLEHLLLGLADHRQLVEVVHHEHGVEAGLLGGHGLGGDALEELGGRHVRIREERDLETDVRAVHDRHHRSSKAFDDRQIHDVHARSSILGGHGSRGRRAHVGRLPAAEGRPLHRSSSSRRELDALGLTGREFLVLTFVRTGDGLSQQGLSERLGLDPTLVVGLVDALEDRGRSFAARRTRTTAGATSCR